MIPAREHAYEHLARMSDSRGLFEHAKGTVRREEHGYCTDDNARLLLITARDTPTATVDRLGRLALRFVLAAQAPDGRCRNRLDRTGRWTDAPETHDWWGRSLWGFGVAATAHPDVAVRDEALRAFGLGAARRSTWSRAMAFAALGAADVLEAHPEHHPARALLSDAIDTIGEIPAGHWSWPEPRLTYANAAVAEAVIAAGNALGDTHAVERGLEMLGWLLALETERGHLSVTPVGGRGPEEPSHRFDQQPIEVAAMADACWRAARVTGDPAWFAGITTAAEWFTGANDSGLVMHNSPAGGGYDGLHSDSVNRNQGAESTLAFIATMQRANEIARAA